jgi:hypothetical protein
MPSSTGDHRDDACRCRSVDRFDGNEATDYAEAHLRQEGSDDVNWTSDYACPGTGLRWRLSHPWGEQHGAGPPRLERIDLTEQALSQRVVLSKAIHDEDRRPIYVYRSTPAIPDDSGWTATAGETTDLVADDLHWAHMSHLVARWPELARVFADLRAESHWEWDEENRRYGEVVAPG